MRRRPPAAPAGVVEEAHEDGRVPPSLRQPVASINHLASLVAVVIVRSWVSGTCMSVERSQAVMPLSRMILRTRRIEVRTPRSWRSGHARQTRGMP